MKTRVPSAAYHEAGHAVAAIVLGMRVDVASIETTGYPAGYRLRGGVIAGFNHGGVENRHEAESAATAGLSGEQAERLWALEKPWRHVKNPRHYSLSGDHAYVNDVLRAFMNNPGDKRRTIARLKVASRTLLNKHWNSVEDVAEKLARYKSIDEKELKRLVAH